MNIILFDVESCEEHNEIKYSSIGQTTAELRSFLCLDVSIRNRGKGIKIEINKAFWMIVNRTNFLHTSLIKTIKTEIL